MAEKFPVLKGFLEPCANLITDAPENSFTLKVWCPVCCVWHSHSPEPGHRVAHCAGGPFKNSGYAVRPFGLQELREIAASVPAARRFAEISRYKGTKTTQGKRPGRADNFTRWLGTGEKMNLEETASELEKAQQKNARLSSQLVESEGRWKHLLQLLQEERLPKKQGGFLCR